jgi:hypothetical protein
MANQTNATDPRLRMPYQDRSMMMSNIPEMASYREEEDEKSNNRRPPGDNHIEQDEGSIIS